MILVPGIFIDTHDSVRKMDNIKTMSDACSWSIMSKKYNQYSFPPHRKQNNERRCLSMVRYNLKTLWCHISVIFSVILSFPLVSCQTVEQDIRPFPPLFNVAQNRPIITEPSQSTCGVNSRSAYCKSATFPISVVVCEQDFCIQTCPQRTQMPISHNLLPPTGGFSKCVIADTINRRPWSSPMSYSTSFISTGASCSLTPAVNISLGSALEYSFTVWIWQQKNNDG